ncbi:MAG: hypothetical protein LBI96_00870 [Odoribacteraceae bacterium]|nr:hypothetical protein [Odoribacteraceae bacterium]
MVFVVWASTGSATVVVVASTGSATGTISTGSATGEGVAFGSATAVVVASTSSATVVAAVAEPVEATQPRWLSLSKPRLNGYWRML